MQVGYSSKHKRMTEALNILYKNEYNRVAQRQNKRYGNQVTTSEHSLEIAYTLTKWINNRYITLPEAKKIIRKLAKAEYGEYGLNTGTIGQALGEFERDIPLPERAELEIAIVN